MKAAIWIALRVLVLAAAICSLWNLQAKAQSVSDSDFVSVIDPWDGQSYVLLDPFQDTNFHMAIMLDNSTALKSITIPLKIDLLNPWTTDLIFDSTVVDSGTGNKAVTYGPSGRNPLWTSRSYRLAANAESLLITFISAMPFLPSNDTLCYVHFDYTGNVLPNMATVDSADLAPGGPLRITDTTETDHVPSWQSGEVTWLWDDVGGGSSPVPLSPVLYPASPNPFNASTSIRYTLPTASNVTLRIHNILGQHVRTLVNQPMSAGEHQITWNGTDTRGNEVSSGVYLIVMQAGSERVVRKGVVVK